MGELNFVRNNYTYILTSMYICMQPERVVHLCTGDRIKLCVAEITATLTLSTIVWEEKKGGVGLFLL